jgi:hypothetical protein
MRISRILAAVIVCLPGTVLASGDTATRHIRDPEPPVYKTITVDGEFVCEVGNSKTDCTASEYAEFFAKRLAIDTGKFKTGPVRIQ